MRKKIITGIAIVSIISSSIFLTRANLESGPSLPPGLYGDPDNCKNYYLITPEGQEIKLVCGGDFVYDVVLQRCVGMDTVRNPAPPCNTGQ